MIIRCTKCSTEFDLDPSQVGPEGVTLRCSVCSHMFHAEPEPEPDSSVGPWRMATVEKHLFELSTLREIVEQVEDGRLRPDDQISHTGQHWLRLGEIPEFSPLFLGQEGLPRMFRAIEAPSALELGPPPSFGTGVDDPAPVRREETHRFDLGHDPLPEPALPTLDDDDPLPAPPQFDTPPVPAPRSTRSQRRTGASNVSSMLDAVTKAVSSDSHPRVEDEGTPRPGASRGERSQPILVSDLARAAAQSVAAAVQRVEGQRASERAAREKSPRSSGSESSRPGPELSARLESSRSAELAPSASDLLSARGGERSATSAAVSAAVAGAPLSVQPNASSLSSLSASVAGSEPSHVTHADALRPPDVVIVKVADPQNKGAAGVYALAGVIVALGIVFGVPGIRERLLNLGGDTQVAVKGDNLAPAVEPSEFAAARSAMRTLGLAKTKQAITDLERIIDDSEREPAVVAAAKLTQAEVMLLRVLSSQIALMLDPDNRDLPRVIDADLADAGALVEGIVDSADPVQLARLGALLALAQGKFDAEVLRDVSAPELRTLVLGAPLWRSAEAPVPGGLITSLQGVSNPSSLHQSLLALALWRSGDDEGARKVLDGVLGRVGDMSAAVTLRAALDKSAAEKGEVLPPPPEPPPDPALVPQVPPEDPIRPESGDPAASRPRPPPVADATDVLISTGCQKVRSSDPDGGIKLLLQAHDKLGGSRNLDLCLCLGAGFLAKNTHDSALSWFKRAVGQAPANREAIAGAARSAELAGKHGVAVEYYRKLVDVEPNNQSARNYLAKHDNSGKTSPPPEEPGDLLPVGKKSP